MPGGMDMGGMGGGSQPSLSLGGGKKGGGNPNGKRNKQMGGLFGMEKPKAPTGPKSVHELNQANNAGDGAGQAPPPSLNLGGMGMPGKKKHKQDTGPTGNKLLDHVRAVGNGDYGKTEHEKALKKKSLKGVNETTDAAVFVYVCGDEDDNESGAECQDICDCLGGFYVDVHALPYSFMMPILFLMGIFGLCFGFLTRHMMTLHQAHKENVPMISCGNFRHACSRRRHNRHATQQQNAQQDGMGYTNGLTQDQPLLMQQPQYQMQPAQQLDQQPLMQTQPSQFTPAAYPQQMA
jgi:hypothetical protein